MRVPLPTLYDQFSEAVVIITHFFNMEQYILHYSKIYQIL